VAVGAGLGLGYLAMLYMLLLSVFVITIMFLSAGFLVKLCVSFVSLMLSS
jgi:hypothetical protein